VRAAAAAAAKEEGPGPDLRDDGPIFDEEEALESVQGDEELLEELIRIFFDDWPAQRESIAAASARGDFTTVARSAHALCGALGNLHAGLALRAARELERAAESRDAGRIESAVARLTGAVAQFKAYRPPSRDGTGQ
jgi:HPt (histidine-containing phosphotransfer) domain-containing protein